MKKSLLLALSTFLVLFIMASCGGDRKQESSRKRPGAGSASGQILTWAHIPIYPSSAQEDGHVFTEHEVYRRMETRKFVTPDSVHQVRAFYLRRMPDRGWRDYGQEDIDDVHQMTWGTADKNTMCWVRIKEGSSDEGTEIEIIRAQGKK